MEATGDILWQLFQMSARAMGIECKSPIRWMRCRITQKSEPTRIADIYLDVNKYMKHVYTYRLHTDEMKNEFIHILSARISTPFVATIVVKQ